MYKEVWEKYIKGFKFLIPFILVQVLFQSTSLNLQVSEYGFFEGDFSVFKRAVSSNLAPILFSLFIGSLFYSFLTVVIKALVNEKHINYRENFKESLGIYFKYLGLNIIISAILIGIMLLGFVDILIPIIFILVIYLNVIFIPCEAYLVYNNASPVEALKKGIVVGKKHSGEIILLGIVLCIIVGTITAVSINLETNTIGYTFINFIETSALFYANVFAMVICKKEAEIKGMLEY